MIMMIMAMANSDSDGDDAEWTPAHFIASFSRNVQPLIGTD